MKARISEAATRDLVAIGASAGGTEPLQQLVAGLPRDLPAALLVVVHIGANASTLPELLSRQGTLPASFAEDGVRISHGHIYVAPADQHMLIADGRLATRRGPRENGSRPAIDPLFRSAARYYGTRTIGVVLSGALDDGAAGLGTIKAQGGLAVVQDPAEAAYPSMPESALKTVEVDHVVSSYALAPLITRLVRQRAPAPVPSSALLDFEVGVAERAGDGLPLTIQTEPAPVLSCPDCGGRLVPVETGQGLRFRCTVGHSHTAHTLIAAQSTEVERALWVALRTNQERAALLRRMAEDARQGGRSQMASLWDKKASEYEGHAAALRELLATGATAALEPAEVGG